MFQHFNHGLSNLILSEFRLWIGLAVVRMNSQFIVSLANRFRASFLPSLWKHIKHIFHSKKLYDVLNALSLINVLTDGVFSCIDSLLLAELLDPLAESGRLCSEEEIGRLQNHRGCRAHLDEQNNCLLTAELLENGYFVSIGDFLQLTHSIS